MTDQAPSLYMMARRNLSRNRFRSVLACAGIAIGVFAIASLGIFGNVLSYEASSSIGEIGNEVVVTPNQDEGFTTIRQTDIRRIRRVTARADVDSAAISTDGGLVANGDATTFVTILGTDDPADVFTAARGEIPESYRSGAVVGSEVADELDVRIGDRIETEMGPYRVRAVLRESDGGEVSPVRPDESVVLPASEVGGPGSDQVLVKAESGRQAREVADEIRRRVNARQDRVNVFELSSVINEIEEFFSLLRGFLVGLGGISLLVAGVSILNVMMMSVVERKGEIGVMRAVGGQRRDVMRIILIEALLLGVVGSTVGVALTAVAVAGLYLGTPVSAAAVLNTGTVLYLVLALSVGIAVSVLSGVYPAWSAANEDPVDAIRG